MVTVTCLKYNAPLTSVSSLKGLKRVEHQCATPECALQVVRDLVTVAEDEVTSGQLYGYSISVGRNKDA